MSVAMRRVRHFAVVVVLLLLVLVMKLLLVAVVLLMWLQVMLLLLRLLLVGAIVLMLVAGVLLLLLTLHMIAVHDPRVVRVRNFQSSALLIIGIYPSRYHENKFPSKRSTGKRNQKRRSAASSLTLFFFSTSSVVVAVACLRCSGDYLYLPLFAFRRLRSHSSNSKNPSSLFSFSHRVRPIYLSAAFFFDLLLHLSFPNSHSATTTIEKPHAYVCASGGRSVTNCKFIFPLANTHTQLFICGNV